MTQGNYPRAQAVQRHMPCPTTPSHNLFVTVYRAFVLGLSHFRQADLHSAEQYYRLALTPTEDLTGPQSSGSATLAALLGEVLYERGEWQSLQTLVTPRLSQIDTNAPLDALFGAYASLARRALLMGEPTQARYLLEHAQQLATLRRWPRLQAWLLVEEIRIHLACEQLPQALELQAQFEALDLAWQDDSLQTMAQAYAVHIRQQQAHGPYHLLGWSLGGALTLLVAQELEAQGQEVAFAGLVDSYVAGTAQASDGREDLQDFLRFVLGVTQAEAQMLMADEQHSAEQVIEAALATHEHGVLGAAELSQIFAVGARLKHLALAQRGLPQTRVQAHHW